MKLLSSAAFISTIVFGMAMSIPAAALAEPFRVGVKSKTTTFPDVVDLGGRSRDRTHMFGDDVEHEGGFVERRRRKKPRWGSGTDKGAPK